MAGRLISRNLFNFISSTTIAQQQLYKRIYALKSNEAIKRKQSSFIAVAFLNWPDIKRHVHWLIELYDLKSNIPLKRSNHLCLYMYSWLYDSRSTTCAIKSENKAKTFHFYCWCGSLIFHFCFSCRP